MKRRLLAGSAVLVALSAAAWTADLPSAWRNWRYSRSILIGPANTPGFCSAHLAADVFPHADSSLDDLRIIDDRGAEVAYSLAAEENSGSFLQKRRANLRENSYVRGQYTQVLLDLGKEASFHNTINISTPEANFMNWVEVAASDDTRVWRIVKARAPISRFRQENLDGNQALRYSENNARYIRLRIFETSHQFPVTDAEIYFEKRAAEPVREAVPISAAADPSAPSSITRWSADFDSTPYPVSQIAVETSQPEFFRAVRVLTSADGKDWTFSCAGEIYRYKVGDKLEESLRVPVYGPNRARGERYWRVEILNQNDAPLEAVSARFLMDSRTLFFVEKPGHTYRLLYGNDRAKRPYYDLQRIVYSTGYKPTGVSAELGLEEVTTNYGDPHPFTERHPNLLWVALGVAVILLAYAAMKSLRPLPSQNP